MIFLYEKKILTWHTKWNVKCCRLINQLIITKKISSCAILEKQTFFINRDGRMILLNIIAYNNKDFISLNFLKVNSAVFYSSKFSFKNKFYEGHIDTNGSLWYACIINRTCNKNHVSKQGLQYTLYYLFGKESSIKKIRKIKYTLRYVNFSWF